jgi:restriction system protein
MMARIEGQLPGTWQELEALVGRVLAECSYYVEVQKNVKLARGDVDIDVWADDHSSPPNVIAIECKRWKTSVPKNVVHAFRAVVGDSGANTGLLISAAGFQDGAVEAAQYSNVRLLTWDEFQQMFAARWYGTFMAPRLFAEAGPLIDYIEPDQLTYHEEGRCARSR